MQQHYSISSAARNQTLWPEVGEFEIFLSLDDEPQSIANLTSQCSPYDYGAVVAADGSTITSLELPIEKSIGFYNFHQGNTVSFFDNTQKTAVHTAVVTTSVDNFLTFSPSFLVDHSKSPQYVLRTAPPAATGSVVSNDPSTGRIELDTEVIASVGSDVLIGPHSNRSQKWILHLYNTNNGIGSTHIVKQALGGHELKLAGNVTLIGAASSYAWELWPARQTCRFPQNDSTIDLELAQRRQGNAPQGLYQLRLEFLTLPLLSSVVGGNSGSRFQNYESLDTIVEINDTPTLNMFFDSSAVSPDSASHKTVLCIDPKYLYSTQHHSTVAATNQKVWWKVKIRCNLPNGSPLCLRPHPAIEKAFETSSQFHLNQVRWTWSLS